ncbi:hypothetical protein EVAR_51588_1 [Eumeta japonica]|uniref:Uncharacterized protein n=1 Tax=Eumeta variegata TaxID=151549 RepID=A0A4C1YH80_EUMVA|nr:hypothetical protein EVAR_51588_1 [Eumeta japonica]
MIYSVQRIERVIVSNHKRDRDRSREWVRDRKEERNGIEIESEIELDIESYPPASEPRRSERLRTPPSVTEHGRMLPNARCDRLADIPVWRFH